MRLPCFRILLATALLATLAPSRPGEAQPAPRAETRWTPGAEFRSKHYRILSDLAPDDTRAYAAHLDLMYEEYARRLSSLAQRAPEIPFVLLFARQQDYLDVMRTRYAINAAGSGGMFFTSPNGSGLALFMEGLPRTRVLHVIQHEGFHQFAHSRFVGALPPWVNEGLAEYFGEAIVVEGRVIVGQSSPGPVEAIRKAVEQNATIDFLRMLTMDGEEWNANVRTGNAAIQYMQAWSMVQFLSWAEGGRYQRPFEGYLARLHAGMPSDRAFIEAFGTRDIASFETAWRAWARTTVPSALGTAAMRLTYLADGLRELSREGIRAESLEDLISKLRDRGFATEVVVHGRTERIEADARALEIPKDELSTEQPVFDLIPPKLSRQTVAERKREEAHPTPPVITTRGLQPRELVLKWTRGKDGTFDYEILSPKKAPPPAKPSRPDRAPKRASSENTSASDGPGAKAGH
ncbi:MAG: DUF1570 domain-containing protein [Phycisphaerales bacterium]